VSSFDDFLQQLQNQKLPPIHNWSPPMCRDFDLKIDVDGVWYYLGTPFQRTSLVRLLATVLLREENDYYLISPDEKLRIQVADVPFIITDFEYKSNGTKSQLLLETNVGYKVAVGSSHKLFMRAFSNDNVCVPYVTVRDSLEARFSRSAFYRLVEMCDLKTIDGCDYIGIESGGIFHSLGLAEG
jgi:uncharacterized protein